MAAHQSGGDRQPAQDRQHERRQHESEQEPDPTDQHLARVPLEDARFEQQRQHEQGHSHADDDVRQPLGLVHQREYARPEYQKNEDRTQKIHGPPRVAVCVAADDME
jgi:hypothetical protein